MLSVPDITPACMQVRTILSQNTTDTNSVRAFKSLKERFPTWDSVRTAPEGGCEDDGRWLAAHAATCPLAQRRSACSANGRAVRYLQELSRRQSAVAAWQTSRPSASRRVVDVLHLHRASGQLQYAVVAYCHAMLDAVMLSFLLLGHTGYTAEGAWRVHPGVHQVAISTASARLPLNQLLLRLDHGPTRSIVVSTITENMELV